MKVGGCTCWLYSSICAHSLGNQSKVVPVANHEAPMYPAIPQIAHVQLQAHEHLLQFGVFNSTVQQLCTSNLEIQHQHPRKGLERLAALQAFNESTQCHATTGPPQRPRTEIKNFGSFSIAKKLPRVYTARSRNKTTL